MILIYLFAKDLTIIHIQIYFERISLIFYKKNLLSTISKKKKKVQFDFIYKKMILFAFLECIFINLFSKVF